MLAEGALNAAFVPIWMRIRDQGGDTRAFAQNVFGLMLLGLGAFAILCALFAPLVVHALAPGFDSTGERFADAVAFLSPLSPTWRWPEWSLSRLQLNAQGVATAAFSIVVFNAIPAAGRGAGCMPAHHGLPAIFCLRRSSSPASCSSCWSQQRSAAHPIARSARA